MHGQRQETASLQRRQQQAVTMQHITVTIQALQSYLMQMKVNALRLMSALTTA